MSGGSPRYDVVVLGSGAAGLSAALSAAESGSSVLLVEKEDLLGGTTAMSGGTCWFPNNPLMQGQGLADSEDDALAYVRSLSLGYADDSLLTELVRRSGEVVEWLMQFAGVRFTIVDGYPDYHPERPGGKPGGGRSLDPGLYSYERLGKWRDRVVMPPRDIRMRLPEIPLGGGSGIIDEEVRDRRIATDQRGCGLALIGPLLKSCVDHGVTIMTGWSADRLLMEPEGCRGVELVQAAERLRVTASKGVIVATGGFEWDERLVRAFLRGPMTAPASNPACSGDAVRLFSEAGALLGNMREAWWVPCVRQGDEQFHGKRKVTPINRERTLPRTIFVNRAGKRFVNEATNYNAMAGAFHALDPASFEYVNLPAWMVFDSTYLSRYRFLGYDSLLDCEWVVSAPTLRALAQKTGMNEGGLEETIAQWNTDVAAEFDGEYGRGESSYDLWAGDRAYRGTKRATLGPIDGPPYYAIRVESGTLGTKGGAQTNAKAQVLAFNGEPVNGLYAAGNCAASACAMFYGGAGGTLGPALTFGYLAGKSCSAAG